MIKDLAVTILADKMNNDCLKLAIIDSKKNRTSSASQKHAGQGKTTSRRCSAKEASYGAHKSFCNIIAKTWQLRLANWKMEGLIEKDSYTQEEFDKVVGWLNNNFDFAKFWVYKNEIHVKIRRV